MTLYLKASRLNLVDFGMNIQEALASPRLSFVEPDVIVVEEAAGDGVIRGTQGARS